MYAAKKTFDYLVRDDDYTWTQPDEVTTQGGLIIKATGLAGRSALEAIIEYEYTDAEDEWHPSDYDCRGLDVMRAEHFTPRAAPELRVVEGGKKERAPRPERAPKPSRDGLVSVGDIAKELGVEPREARGVLRSLKLPKPDAGWAWPAAEAETIKTKIKEGLK
jgi:hypothetical protein